ncbi:hypothetical protein LZ554_003766 [Drepanopeziza brunnea f. sp. 'monogermtubi']|nr:hypothetical protein LZ554_003766 [Drepanopeziza brunnea f. sp. 'monogermtubi']
MSASSGKYTIVSGDTFFAIAQRLNVDVASIQSMNPGVLPESLQVGQVINIPGPAGQPVPSCPAPTSAPSAGTYTITSGDTFDAIARRIGVDVASVQASNPGVRPESLQVGQVIRVPPKPAAASSSQHGAIRHTHQHIAGYDNMSGPCTNFPHPQRWASYEHLLRINERLMLLSSSPSEVAAIKKWIPIVAYESGVDPRVILCIIMQESGGNVRVPTTLSPAPDFIKNTGLMQAHNGQEWDARYPEWCIERMIRDGAQGTRHGDGLIQCFHKWDRNWYHACRAYNSGRVNRDDLSDGITATGHYVERVANRLVGNTWAGM